MLGFELGYKYILYRNSYVRFEFGFISTIGLATVATGGKRLIHIVSNTIKYYLIPRVSYIFGRTDAKQGWNNKYIILTLSGPALFWYHKGGGGRGVVSYPPHSSYLEIGIQRFLNTHKAYPYFLWFRFNHFKTNTSFLSQYFFRN